MMIRNIPCECHHDLRHFGNNPIHREDIPPMNFGQIWYTPCNLAALTLDRENMIKAHAGDTRLQKLIEIALMSDLIDNEDED